MSAMPSQSNRNVYDSCKYQVVWYPKYRRKVLIEGIAEHLKQMITDVCQEHQSDMLRREIMPDHVHLLVECHPQFGRHRFVRLMQGRSSRLFCLEFPVLKLPTLWTKISCVSTVGEAPLSVIKQPIEKQKHV